MSSYLRKPATRAAAPCASSRERDLWLSPYGQPDALRCSQRDRSARRAKDRSRAQRIAQKTDAATRARALHQADRVALASSPARPRPRRKKKAARAASAPPARAAAPGFMDFAAALRRVGDYVAGASDADLRAVYDAGSDVRRAAAALGSACGVAARARRSSRPPAPPGVAFGRRSARPPPSPPQRGRAAGVLREDRAERRSRTKRVARAARESVDLLERSMGPASPISPTPAIDTAVAAALRSLPDDDVYGDGAGSPSRRDPYGNGAGSPFDGGEALDGAFDEAADLSDPLARDEVNAILAGGADIDAILAGSPIIEDDDHDDRSNYSGEP